MNKSFKLNLITGWSCLLLFSACHHDEPIEPLPQRTILVYMAADNNLSSDGDCNIALMKRAVRDIQGKIVLYFDPRHDVPHLMTIGKDGNLDTLKTYKEENSASPEVLARVIEETKILAQTDSYGLILWSHGMSWLPPKYDFPGGYALRRFAPDMPRTKYFGEDTNPDNGQTESSKMEISELAAAIPDNTFDFILFDACFMASIEVFYELKKKADYLIASPAEIIAEGFPYDKIMPLLWGNENEFKLVCEAFYNHYHDQSGSFQSATIALVKSMELDELAQKASILLRDRFPSIAQENHSDVWRYPLSSSNLPDIFYDLREFLREIGNGPELEAFEKQLERTVIYKKTTPKMFGEEVPEDKFSGLSVYIPKERWSSMNDFYSGLSWYRTVY